MSMVEQIPAEAYLRRRRIEFSIVPHTRTYTTVGEAIALGIPADEVLKTVLLRLRDRYAIAVVTGSRRLDMGLIKEATGDHDARLATENEIASLLPDFELGALPPLPGALGLGGYVDPAVFDHEVVVFAAGRRTESLLARSRELFWGEEVSVHPISKDFHDDRLW